MEAARVHHNLVEVSFVVREGVRATVPEVGEEVEVVVVVNPDLLEEVVATLVECQIFVLKHHQVDEAGKSTS